MNAIIDTIQTVAIVGLAWLHIDHYRRETKVWQHIRDLWKARR